MSETEKVRDVYREWDDRSWLEECCARRRQWVEAGAHVEVVPADCDIARAPGALPLDTDKEYDDNNTPDDGRVRAMFLHGMESSPLGTKAMCIAQTCRVCAPCLVPAQTELTIDRVCAAMRAFRPHVLVGSSYGGAVLLALLQRNKWRGPTVLLSPALGLSEPFVHGLPDIDELWLPAPATRAPLIVVHGARDDAFPTEHCVQLVHSVRDSLVLDLAANTGKAADALERLSTAHTALLITDDTHELQRLCATDPESPAVPTLLALIAALAARTSDSDPSQWLQPPPSRNIFARCAHALSQLFSRSNSTATEDNKATTTKSTEECAHTTEKHQ